MRGRAVRVAKTHRFQFHGANLAEANPRVFEKHMSDTTTISILAMLYANSLIGLGLLPVRHVIAHRTPSSSWAYKFSRFFGRLEY